MDPKLAFTHPELCRRYELLVARMWARSFDVGITSSTRSEDTQRAWYALYLRGLWPAIVADPDRFYTTAPQVYGGWAAFGSMHEIQADGYSHALDLYWVGCRPDQFLNEAYMVGLHAVEPTENWHMQAWDVTGTFRCFDDDGDDMDQKTFATYLAQSLGNADAVRTIDDPYGTRVVQIKARDVDAERKTGVVPQYAWFDWGAIEQFTLYEATIDNPAPVPT